MTQLAAVSRVFLFLMMAGLAAGCTAQDRRTLSAAPQEDGWSATVVPIEQRFGSEAHRDAASGQVLGDEGYNLYLLTDAVGLDYSRTSAFLDTLRKHPRGNKNDRSVGHSWLILESPEGLREGGHTGEFGEFKPTYQVGVLERMRHEDPNPIAYLWETMPDGKWAEGSSDHVPSFVWKVPITRPAYRRMIDHLNGRDYSKFSLTERNCTDLVCEVSAIAGINLVHRIRLTLPSEKRYLGMKIRAWTDPRYRVLEFSTPDVLEADLRQLAREGIGQDATQWYLHNGTDSHREEP